MKIAILGAGNVGATLGRGLAAAGHRIAYAVRAPGDPKHDVSRSHAEVLAVPDAVREADAVILATPWAAAEAALASAGDLGGRPLLDATNPIGPGFTLTHGGDDSGGEQVARWAPSARVVKVFNTTGKENMADPRYGAARAAMFVAGDDEAARALALGLARDLGFEAASVGGLSRARVLEPLAMLWIRLAMGLGHGRDVALGLLRREGVAEAPAAAPSEGPPLSVAILGSGRIGAGLGRAWARAGHDVVFGVRDETDPETRALATALGARLASVRAAPEGADVVALAVPHRALDEVLAEAGELAGRVVIDCTNAVGPGFSLVHAHTTSAAEELARRLPRAHVVKSFNAQGAENLAAPVYDGVPAVNFFCGDDAAAKDAVRRLVRDIGFAPIDAGPLASARLLEPLMVVWVLAAQALGTRDLGFVLLRR
ncbi:MAG: NAD(P)-binding domain-containing protein [Sandaracinaceae bacterium]|nr:NAD(P)-binding domain-containing protein [Sandaracinaceae bacterium]